MKALNSKVVQNYSAVLNSYNEKEKSRINKQRINQMVIRANDLMEKNMNIEEAVKLLISAIQMGNQIGAFSEEEFDEVILSMNHYAMRSLDMQVQAPGPEYPPKFEGSFLSREPVNSEEKALFLLLHAEKLVRNKPGYSAYQTASNLYNNLGIVMKRHGFLEQAMQYLRKAQSINFNHKLRTAQTDMNMGVLLSALGK